MWRAARRRAAPAGGDVTGRAGAAAAKAKAIKLAYGSAMPVAACVAFGDHSGRYIMGGGGSF